MAEIMAKKRIMVVDDEIPVARDVKKTLEESGYEVICLISTGEEAVQKAEEHRPDLVLMDIRLQGGMAGIETAEQICTRFNIPIVYLIADEDDNILQKANQTGAYGYIVKPVGDRALKVTIMMALYRAGMEKKLKAMCEKFEQKSLELQVSRENFHSIVEKSGEGIAVVDQEGIIRFVNPAAEILFNRRQDELLGAMFGFPLLSEKPTEIDIIRRGAGKPGVGELQAVETEWEGAKAYLVSIHDITERKEVDSFKDEFVSTASHELRTPLTSMKNAVDILLSGKTGEINPNQKNFLHMAQRNIKRLSQLVNDLLTMSKIEAKKMILDFAPTDMVEIIHSAIDSVKPIADKKFIEIEAVPHSSSLVYADGFRIEEVMINLISNSIKFTHDNGRITIKTGHVQERTQLGTRDFIVVLVEDTGIGMDGEHVDRIFERFYRAENSLSANQPGSGLGLAICKGIIEAHGGKISCKSQKGSGTTISFTLPIG